MQHFDTTSNFISNRATTSAPNVNDVIKTYGYSAIGGVGGARWKATGNVIAVSQDPLTLNDIKLSDASGNEYELVLEEAGIIDLNVLGGTSASYENIATTAGLTFSQGLTSDVSNDIVNIDTAANLIARNGTVVGEAFSVADRASGIFDAKTGLTANGFDILQSSTDISIQYELRIDDGAANIAQFGAAASPADSTGAIQAAIDSTRADSVYTPGYTYNHTGLTLKEGKMYYGEGMESSRWVHTGTGGNAIEYTDTPTAKIRFKDMWLSGNDTDTARVLYIKNGYFLSGLERVRVDKGVINLYLESSWTFTIKDCHIRGRDNDDKGITQNCIYTDGWEAGVMDNTRVEDCLGDAFVIDQILGPATNMFTISGNTKIQRCNGRGVYAKVGMGTMQCYFERVNDDNSDSTNVSITGATQANPVVITAASHGMDNGNVVDISGVVGMTELNGNTYAIANVTTNTFELENIDGTGFTAYTSGGTAIQYTAAIAMNEGGYSYVTNTYLTNSGANTRFVNFNGNTINVQSSHQTSSGGARGLFASNGTPLAVSIGNRYFIATPYDLQSTTKVVLDQTSEVQFYEDSVLIGDPTQLDETTYAIDSYGKDVRFAGNTNFQMVLNALANRRLDIVFQSGGSDTIFMGRGDSDEAGNNVLYVSNTSNDLNPPFSVNVSSGQVRMSDLPTSNPGGSGILWNNSGVINIT